MSPEAFRLSLDQAAPPGAAKPALAALWWAKKGDWDRAHAVVQAHEGDPDCDLVHAHLHRQEGDAANARYWYGRAGEAFAEMPLPEEWAAIVARLAATIAIRPLAAGDGAQWEALWRGYQAFYKVEIPPAASEATWARFFDPAEPVNALVAEADGRLVGLVHYIFHRNTWMVEPVCYLQDLFTAEAARGQGVGGALIEAVSAQARAAGCSRVYWMTHETNRQAMRLYDKVAEKSGFIQYRKPLKP